MFAERRYVVVFEYYDLVFHSCSVWKMGWYFLHDGAIYFYVVYNDDLHGMRM